MSAETIIAAIAALNAINAAGRAIIDLTSNATELRALFAQAAAEGRDITTLEVAALSAKTQYELEAHAAAYQAAIDAKNAS